MLKELFKKEDFKESLKKYADLYNFNQEELKEVMKVVSGDLIFASINIGEFVEKSKINMSKEKSMYLSFAILGDLLKGIGEKNLEEQGEENENTDHIIVGNNVCKLRH